MPLNLTQIPRLFANSWCLRSHLKSMVSLVNLDWKESRLNYVWTIMKVVKEIGISDGFMLAVLLKPSFCLCICELFAVCDWLCEDKEKGHFYACLWMLFISTTNLDKSLLLLLFVNVPFLFSSFFFLNL